MVPCPALLYGQSISFFKIFKFAFGNGTRTISAWSDQNKSFSEHIKSYIIA